MKPSLPSDFLRQFVVFLVCHGFQPFGGRAFVRDGYGDMGKPAVLCRAVPMFDAFENFDDITGFKLLRRFAPFLIPPAPRRLYPLKERGAYGRFGRKKKFIEKSGSKVVFNPRNAANRHQRFRRFASNRTDCLSALFLQADGDFRFAGQNKRFWGPNDLPMTKIS